MTPAYQGLPREHLTQRLEGEDAHLVSTPRAGASDAIVISGDLVNFPQKAAVDF